ncbi:MAG: ROK family protein [Frankiaceae bacterium]|nr:ROK family protein [Frankiaceae bacterium]
MGQQRFGVDIGGTGIKGAIVDIDAGVLVTERVRVLTPHPATPESVVPVVAELVTNAGYVGDVGCAFPAVIKDGKACTAANIDPTWIGTSVADAVAARLGGVTVTAINDADAAGVAEVRFGAGKGVNGVVVMVTVGTGIGSAVFVDGVLVPNTELGHLEVDGHVAEHRASEVAREEHDLSRKQWAKRFNRYLEVLEALLWPDLLIIGGGVSKSPDKVMPLLESRAKIVPATLANAAGIIGAALAAG